MTAPTSKGENGGGPPMSELLASVFEALPVAVWSVDAVEGVGLDPATGFFSPAARKLTGMEPEQLTQPGQFLPLVHPEDRPRFLAAWRTVFEEHGEVSITFRVRNQVTGEWVCVLEQSRAVPTAEPGRYRLVGVLHDVTEREQTRRALRESEERMRMLVEGTPYLFFYTQDADGLVTYVSPSVEAITGRSVSEWLGQSHWFTPDTERNRAARRATDVHLRGGCNQGPILVDVTHADGHAIVLEVFEHPVLHGGRVVGLQGVARDVTEQHRMLEAVAHAQKTEAVGLLAAGVAHDVNSRLQSIVSAAELGRSGPPEDVDNRLLDILRLAREGRHLVRRLLAYSQRQVIQTQELSLQELVEELMPLLKELVGPHIRVTMVAGADTPTVSGDPVQLIQALADLAANARDAMPDGGDLRVSIWGEDDGRGTGQWAVIEVADDGCGIPTEDLSRVFDPFFSTKAPGAGLGLPSVQGIVHQHGGTVAIDSRPGSGCRVTVRLPAGTGKPG